MRIPFVKAHGCGNDFLLTWREQAPEHDHAATARLLCDRHRGLGADGWLLVSGAQDDLHDGAIELYNSDGSAAALSGNGTRCAAAFLLRAGLASSAVRILTGAGLKSLRLIERSGDHFLVEMNMGRPVSDPAGLRFSLPLSGGARQVAIVDVGNPQCAVFVGEIPPDWVKTAAEIEGHRHFPRRTNVSFVRVVDEHTLDVRFYERGAGETMSSGTGSTGAAAAAMMRGLVRSPVKVMTPAGPLDLRWEDDIFLTGPADIVAEGVFLA